MKFFYIGYLLLISIPSVFVWIRTHHPGEGIVALVGILWLLSALVFLWKGRAKIFNYIFACVLLAQGIPLLLTTVRWLPILFSPPGAEASNEHLGYFRFEVNNLIRSLLLFGGTSIFLFWLKRQPVAQPSGAAEAHTSRPADL